MHRYEKKFQYSGVQNWSTNVNTFISSKTVNIFLYENYSGCETFELEKYSINLKGIQNNAVEVLEYLFVCVQNW